MWFVWSRAASGVYFQRLGSGVLMPEKLQRKHACPGCAAEVIGGVLVELQLAARGAVEVAGKGVAA